MLSEIHIKNFNIAENVRVEFGRGFHVISGETGAGKSILLQAVAFALGARGEVETIRAGAEEAVVTLTLEAPSPEFLQQSCAAFGVGVPEDGLLYLKRSLNSSSRSRALVNDEPVTLKTLQALGERCIHLVRQHAAQRLLEEDFLLKLLDRYGNHEASAQSYRESFRRHREIQKEWEKLQERVSNSRRQEEFLRFQCEELRQADLKAGEEEALESAKARLKHRVALATRTFEMQQILVEGDDAVSDRLGKVLSLGEKSCELDAALEPVAEAVREALAAVDTAGRKLADYTQSLNEDPNELEQIEERLAKLADLRRKYGCDEAGLIALLENLKNQVGELENFDRLLAVQEEAKNAAERELQAQAQALHERRLSAAKRLVKHLQNSLHELALPQARLEFALEASASAEHFRENGADRLALLVSFNAGEALRPFAEIISGGELSRLLLAFYEIVFPAEEIGTFIFDEVDAGVGGKVAELIGRKLEALSQKTQVLCVTHLPQIACRAERHYTVEKLVRQGRTFSEIRRLSPEEREQEIARMLAGVEITPQALRHARELLKNAAA